MRFCFADKLHFTAQRNESLTGQATALLPFNELCVKSDINIYNTTVIMVNYVTFFTLEKIEPTEQLERNLKNM